MTFAEWRAMYPGVTIAQPHEEAPDVYLISGRDPLNQGGGNTWDPPLAALFDLSDYWVSTHNVHRGSIWIAPKVERDDWTRADYMASRCSHEQYYGSIARLIGLKALISLVAHVAPKERIAANLDDLNRIPLDRWDGMDGAVRDLLRHEHMARTWNGVPLKPRTICWSLSESVCVLKAAARLWVTTE